jgi:hypothetical protein
MKRRRVETSTPTPTLDVPLLAPWLCVGLGDPEPALVPEWERAPPAHGRGRAALQRVAAQCSRARHDAARRAAAALNRSAESETELRAALRQALRDAGTAAPSSSSAPTTALELCGAAELGALVAFFALDVLL